MLRRYHPNIRSLIAATLALLVTAAVLLASVAYGHEKPPQSTLRLSALSVPVLSIPTTTTPPAPVERHAQPPRAARASGSAPIIATPETGSVNGYPCGGDLPPCRVLRRESGGDPRKWNMTDYSQSPCHQPIGWTGRGCGRGASDASGLWQFLRSTWARYGGYLNGADAPPDVQNAKARLLWANGRGCSHWAACGR